MLAGLAASCLIALCAVVVKQDGGWRSRVSNEVAVLDDARMPVIPFQACDEKRPDSANTNCVIGQLDSPRLALIWGDSHALAWAPGLDVLLKREGLKGILAVNSGCAPLMGLYNPSDNSCLQDNKHVMKWLHRNPVERLYLIGYWPAWSITGDGYELSDASGVHGNSKLFPPALKRTITGASPFARHIVLIGATPGAPDELPLRLALHYWKGTVIPARITLAEARQMAWPFWQAVAGLAKTGNLQLVDPITWFCDQQKCNYVKKNGAVLFRDGDHLSVTGALFASDRLIAESSRSGTHSQDKH